MQIREQAELESNFQPDDDIEDDEEPATKKVAGKRTGTTNTAAGQRNPRKPAIKKKV